jgi:putative transposase
VERTLNGLLDAEADDMCHAQRYERSAEREDTRAGHYPRRLHTQAGEVERKVPKLRRQTFETAIIARYRRRDTSVDVDIVQMCLAGCLSRWPGSRAQLGR